MDRGKKKKKHFPGKSVHHPPQKLIQCVRKPAESSSRSSRIKDRNLFPEVSHETFWLQHEGLKSVASSVRLVMCEQKIPSHFK